MKVLHICSSHNPMAAQYAAMLGKAMQAMVETLIVEEEKAHHVCRSFQPDIVHLHGDVKMPLPGSARIVVSAHGDPIAREAYVVVARSEMERKRLAETQPRVEVVRNPLITRSISQAQAAGKMLTIYQRVADSNPLALLDAKDRQELAILLKAGITGDKRWVEPEGVEMPLSRHLYIYAQQEGVIDCVKRGMHVLGIEPPALPAPHNFLPKDYKTPEPLHTTDVVKIVGHIKDNGLSLLRIVELDEALRSPLLNEQRLVEELKLSKLTALTASLLTIAAEQTLLGEGFMPLPPAKGALTNRLRKQLAQHLTI